MSMLAQNTQKFILKYVRNIEGLRGRSELTPLPHPFHLAITWTCLSTVRGVSSDRPNNLFMGMGEDKFLGILCRLKPRIFHKPKTFMDSILDSSGYPKSHFLNLNEQRKDTL